MRNYVRKSLNERNFTTIRARVITSLTVLCTKRLHSCVEVLLAWNRVEVGHSLRFFFQTMIFCYTYSPLRNIHAFLSGEENQY